MKNNQPFNNIQGYIYQSDITNHYSTISILSTSRKTNKTLIDSKTDNINYNVYIDNLKYILQNTNWTEILHLTDENIAIDLFINIIKNSIKILQETVIKKIPNKRMQQKKLDNTWNY
jgi:predicted alpha/beta superfamily hydrolase